MELKIYITDLAAYNQSHLVGEWVTLPMDADELNEKVQEILKKGSDECGFNEIHEEYFITDYEFENEKLFEVSEYSNLIELNEKCQQCEELEEDDQKKLSYLIDHAGYDFDDALEKYEEVTIYENTTLEEVVEEYIEQTINLDDLPAIISRNIDYKSIAYDFEISGEYEKIDSDIYYFVNCQEVLNFLTYRNKELY